MGVAGLDAPPVELNRSARTSGDGSVLVKRRSGDRYVTLPMYINTGSAVRSAISHLADVFRGPGQFRVSENETDYRTLRDVYYDTGLAGEESSDLGMLGVWRKVVVSLVALDPWWYGNAVEREMTFGGTTAFDVAATFNNGTVPFDGGNSTTFQVVGHADAYPVWTIEGPFTSLTVVKEGAGAGSFQLAAALADGDTLTVDTRPGSRGPSMNGGGVNWSLLTAASSLPTFVPGTVSVSVGSAGSDAGSSVTATYEPRWLTA